MVSDGLRVGAPRWLTEPARPAAIRNRPGACWLAVGAVCIGAFMGQLDASIVTLALPSLQHQFHASVGAVTWVGLSYLLTLVVMVTAVGRLSDMLGHKLLYVYGFAVFILGSALCGLAPGLVALDGFRVLEGIGAAMLQANSVAIIAVAVPSRSLGRALGIQGAAQAVGLALGPTVGGFLLAAGGWRLLFYVNVPVGVLGLVAGILFIPRSRYLQDRTPFDWSGLAVFLPAVVALLSAVSFVNTAGWRSPLVVGLATAGVALGATFVLVERRSRAPMMDLGLFRRRPFAVGIASGALSYIVLFGVLLTVPFFLERGAGVGPARAGLELMAMPLAIGLTAPLAGRLADRVGPRSLTIGGMALAASALVFLATFHGSTSWFLAGLLVVGVGLGLFTAPNNATIMGSTPSSQRGMASGILNMTRGMGTALGLALTGLVYAAAGGDGGSPSVVGHAFSVTLWFLAAVAAVAAGLSTLRGGVVARDPLSSTGGPG